MGSILCKIIRAMNPAARPGKGATELVASTALGKIKGRPMKTRKQRDIVGYLNVPYAKPPVDQRRFALPVPMEPWPDIFDGTSKSPKQCTQKTPVAPESERIIVGEEDCLCLNVYTPQLPSGGNDTTLLPVIIWIHGGAFCIGSADYRAYGPDYILDHDIVMVGINYRLGPLGFFCLENDAAPGNLGMHDQVAAMKWVKNHIVNFGGDPANVTLMGESAGAMSIFLHLVSPLSKGLFHKIMVVSGSGTTPFLASNRRAKVYSRKYAEELGAAESQTSDEEALQKLQKVPHKKLVAKTTIFKDFHPAVPCPWKPVVDGEWASKPFLPQSFNDAVKAGNFDKSIPILAMTCSEEGLIMSVPFYQKPKLWSVLFDDWAKWGAQYFFGKDVEITPRERLAMDRMRQRFFTQYQDEMPPYTDANLKVVEEILSLSIFKAPLERDLASLAEAGATTIHRLNFAYVGFFTIGDLFRLTPGKLFLNMFGRHMGLDLYRKRELGTCHGDDIFYLFPMGMPGLPKAIKTPRDLHVSQTIVDFFAQFATSGSPGWDLYTSANQEMNKFQVMTIGRDGTTEVSEYPPEELKLCRFVSEIHDELHSDPPNLSEEPITQCYKRTADARYIGNRKRFCNCCH